MDSSLQPALTRPGHQTAIDGLAFVFRLASPRNSLLTPHSQHPLGGTAICRRARSQFACPSRHDRHRHAVALVSMRQSVDFGCGAERCVLHFAATVCGEARLHVHAPGVDLLGLMPLSITRAAGASSGPELTDRRGADHAAAPEQQGMLDEEVVDRGKYLSGLVTTPGQAERGAGSCSQPVPGAHRKAATRMPETAARQVARPPSLDPKARTTVAGRKCAEGCRERAVDGSRRSSLPVVAGTRPGARPMARGDHLRENLALTNALGKRTKAQIRLLDRCTPPRARSRQSAFQRFREWTNQAHVS